MEQNILLRAEHVHKSFEIDATHSLKVLEDINLVISNEEIVAFLGKSGTGKSTFLRIIAGLMPASSGQIIFHDQVIDKPSRQMSMVFQNFALLPWLTVFENVALGLEAFGLPREQINSTAQKMIELIGLAGYEKTFPKELSGGMKQRVGFARALAVEPELLLLDEPFSALDIYTAHKIKTDLINLWESKQIKTRSMILVTHNVEEAVLMSDRVLVWDSHPGKIAHEFKIDTPRTERTRRSMLDLVEEISHCQHNQIAHAERKRAERN